ncbi:restriction endonuclease subunit S [Chryseobacterium sp. MHB01]|uniref:restriction endonuclease subunit S n=1 Tax=Chryseobacterium sp. MHB01 TaxID=3109433 RepID=UPI002AFDDE90|nr:restriction endonuclease subunit S [Chryseobacterium sp. MHB01]
MTLSNWSVGAILSDKVLYKEGFKLEPIGNLIIRNREKEILEDDKAYKQVTIKLYGKGVVQRGDELIFGKDIGTKNQFRVSEGQFIMSKIDARNGAFGIVPAELEGAITTQDFLSYNINREKILPEFFNLITGTKHFAELCQKASSGTTGRQRVDEKAFLGFRIPVPDKDIQKKLVEGYFIRIRKSDKYIKSSEKSILKSDETFLNLLDLKQLNKVYKNKKFQIFNFKDFGRWDVFSLDNTIYASLKKSKFEVKSLGQAFLFTRRKWSPKLETEKYISYIEIGDVDPIRGIVNSTKTETRKAPSRASQLVFENDLIIGTTRPYLKKFAIVSAEFHNQVCSSGFSVVAPNENYNLEYLRMFLISEYGIEQLKNNMSGALYPAITLSKLQDILIPFPPLSVQNEIVEKVNFELKDVVTSQKLAEKEQELANREFESAIFNID